MSHASEDTKKLLIGFDVDEEELTGTGSIFLIDGLKTIRDKIKRSRRETKHP